MKTVHEVSRLAGVSIRTLQYYDSIGLLCPAARTAAGYRLYDSAALERLQQILLFRELEFSLQEIKDILDSPGFSRSAALEQQIELFRLKKEHLDELIDFARRMQKDEVNTMDFTAFDNEKMDAYARKAKEKWGGTAAYREFEEKSDGRQAERENALGAGLMELFRQFGAMKSTDAHSAEAHAQVEKLRAYITEHYYDCTAQMLCGLGQMYAGGGEMTENIDSAGGEGTASFAAESIRIYCGLE